MKKFVFLGLVLAVGTSMAFAASISVPWFLDSAALGANPLGLADPAPGQMTFITLMNTTASDLTCAIEYFDQDGASIGPASNNTFSLSPNAATAFRPGINDTINESTSAQAVPNRPDTGDGKKNGSAKITYVKNEGDGPSVSGTVTTYAKNGIGYQHLLGQ